MTIFLISLFLGLCFILFISYFRWNLSRENLKKLDLSSYTVYRDKTVLTSARLKAGETFGIPIKSTLLINDHEIHLIPSGFNPFLFMTEFPFSFFKATNKKLKIQRSDAQEITFTARQRKSSIFGSTFEVTIRIDDEEEKRAILKKFKSWR